VATGENTSIDADATTLVMDGDLNVANESRVGSRCGDLAILLAGPGGASFGRRSEITATVCGPERTMFLGIDNHFVGRIVGDVTAPGKITADCCPDPTP
jgi:hypothetical protein